MPYEEYLKWSLYLSRRPVGWREDDRTMKLLQAQGVKAKPSEIFESLKIMSTPVVEDTNVEKPNMSSLKNSALFLQLMSAKGGASIPAEDKFYED